VTGPLRVLYLASLPARPTTSGALVLHRHFSRLGSAFELHQACDAAADPADRNYHELPRRRWFVRMSNTRLFPYVHELHQAVNLGVSRRSIDAVIRRVQPHVLVTVAEGGVAASAADAARRAGLPLVTFLHDWAPGWLRTSRAIRGLAARRFRRLYAASSAVLAVCPELLERLGPHPDAQTLPPLPDDAALGEIDSNTGPLVYAGVYRHVYHRELRALAETFLAAGAARDLRLCGPGPDWSGAPIGQAGIQRGLLTRSELQTQLAAAGVLLVVSPFDPDWDFIARDSFPSKIPEYCRFGKPLLLWAPAHAASARWVQRTQAAALVTSPDPTAVRQAFQELQADPARRRELAARARAAAAAEFSPARIQQQFEDTLRRVASPRPR
jgi:hypothetical protein